MLKKRNQEVTHMKNPYLRICSIALGALLASAALVGCGTEAPQTSNSEPTPAKGAQTYIYEPMHAEHELEAGEPPFTLPDFELERKERYYPFGENTSYYYKNVSATELKSYVEKLESEGFLSVTYSDKTAMLYREDCAVNFSGHGIEKESVDITMTYYVRSEHTSAEAATPEKAKELIDKIMYGEKKAAFPPIDITPEGLYEASGLQIFAQPEHDHPRYSNHRIGLYLVYRGIEVREGYCNAAVADIDGNGKNETWIVEHGKTSGIYSFTLVGYEDGAVKYEQYLYSTVIQPKFSATDGRLTLDFKRLADGRFEGEYLSYDIIINEDSSLELICKGHEGESEFVTAWPPVSDKE